VGGWKSIARPNDFRSVFTARRTTPSSPPPRLMTPRPPSRRGRGTRPDSREAARAWPASRRSPVERRAGVARSRSREEPSSWAPVLQGVGSAYVSYYPDLAIPGAVETVGSFAELAVKSGVPRLVLLASRGEAEAEHAEQAVRESGAELTILRSTWFARRTSARTTGGTRCWAGRSRSRPERCRSPSSTPTTSPTSPSRPANEALAIVQPTGVEAVTYGPPRFVPARSGV
jgi:hypothetical protein